METGAHDGSRSRVGEDEAGLFVAEGRVSLKKVADGG